MAGTRTSRNRRAGAQAAGIVGRRIRELREERGWTQVDLEAQVDGYVKQASISYFETGRVLPSLRTLERIARAFGLDLAMLFLNVNGNEHHRLAAAVLSCPRAKLPLVGKVIGTP